jgi:undecaprenyl-diphosphatase
MNTSHFTVLGAIVLAIVQGVTELFPVSSLGHSVVLPHITGLPLNIESPSFIPLLTLLHLGTATALLIYFWPDWMKILRSLVTKDGDRESRKLFLLLIIGTLPAGLVGLLFEKRLAALFGNYEYVAFFLILNGGILFLGELLRRRSRVRGLRNLTYTHAFMIGMSQVVALLPGFSRSGASLVGGLLVGLTHEAAAEFSFLLATPIIFAAGVLEVPKLLQPQLRPDLFPGLVGGIAAGVVAYIVTDFLMKYFKRHEINALYPFGIYCILLGLFTLVF